MIGITLGVIALAALGGLAIGLYTVIQNSKTTATTTTTGKHHSKYFVRRNNERIIFLIQQLHPNWHGLQQV